MHSLYLAWAYIRFHKVKTLTLIACVTLIASLPLTLDLILRESERQLRTRAETTPRDRREGKRAGSGHEYLVFR